MNSKMVLFGCGKIGYEALSFFGSENVECFCDNNPKLAGSEIYGKNIISFEELNAKYKDAIIMICADYRHSCEILKQCEAGGIFDYLYYLFFNGMFDNREDALSYLDDPLNRMRLRKDIYMLNIDELTRQVKYLEDHIDIRDMKPAKGKLRKSQLSIVGTASEFLEKIRDLEIKPFLDSGNLLGYVRHNGFIPWDDDIDFVLIRDEYEKLKEFCRSSIYTEEEFADKNIAKDNGKCVSAEMEDYYWTNLADLIKVVKPASDGSEIELDFFPWDFYNDDYTYEELMGFVLKVKERLSKAGSLEQKVECLENALEENRNNIAGDSSHLYFGIDNMGIVQSYHRGQMVPKEVIFPLQKVLYEGAYFWVPNDAEEYLKYEYENIWEFPIDVGIQRHLGHSEEDE